jgi:hypothetical protein
MTPSTASGDTHGGFSRMDQSVQQAHVDVLWDASMTLGRELTRPPARLTALMGACATDSTTANDGRCLDDFIRRFGERVLRSPIDGADLAFYREVAASTPVSPDAVADVVTLLLNAPRFVYHVESGDQAVAGARYQLSADELANRLAFHFWQQPPDEPLRQAARSGALLTPEGYGSELDRVIADPRTDRTLDELTDEWLRLHEVPAQHTRLGEGLFDAVRAGFTPTPTLHTEMVDEVLALNRWVVRSQQPLRALLTDRHHFARSDTLATIYGQPAWSGTGEPPLLVAPERSGLLTRPAFHAFGSANTRPIMKGLRIRNGLLCDTIPAPPDNAAVTPLTATGLMTTRETVESITEAPGSACAGCHQAFLNPLGFATEDFDTFGRHRTSQRIFDLDGRLLGEKAVSTGTTPRVVLSDEERSSGAADLTRLLVESRKVETCFARQYVRFTFQRMEDAAGDACTLAELERLGRDGRPLIEQLKAIALRPEFKQRTIE